LTTRPRRTLGWRLGVPLSLAILVAVDGTVGLFVGDDGSMLGASLPPYALLQNDAQRRGLFAGLGCYACFDADLGWTLAPDTRVQDGMYRTNRQGLRSDRNYAMRAPPGVTRVAAFGDSFVHGSEVANAEVWSRLIERDRPDVEVLNFGVGGYGTDQAWLRYRRDGRRFAPDVVLIGLMVENIGRNVSLFRPAYQRDARIPFPKPRFRLDAAGELVAVANPSRSLSDLRNGIESGVLRERLAADDYWVRRSPSGWNGSPLFASSFVRLAYAVLEHRARRDVSGLYADVEGEPFRVTAAIAEAFHREALADGARRAPVVFLPDRPALRAAARGATPYWQPMIAELEAEGVEVIDATPALLDAAAGGDVDALFLQGHYGVAGNAALARALEEALLTGTTVTP
jgi:hypothetical protein